MRTISICSQKGGTGKSSTTAILLAAATDAGLRTLAIDLDPQGSLTVITGAEVLTKNRGSYDLLYGHPAAKLIQHTPMGDIIPGCLNLAMFDGEISRDPVRSNRRNFHLQDALKKLEDSYDLILIDNAPGLSPLMMNALTASDEVLVPTQADVFAWQSVYQLYITVNQVKAITNPGLQILGVFLTRYNDRTTLAKQMHENLKDKCEEYGIPLLSAGIHEGNAVREAQVMAQSVLEYAPRSRPAADYRALINEINLLEV